MGYHDLATEACGVHINHAKELYAISETFLGGGRLRILLWLYLHQQESPCAADVMCHFGLSSGRVTNILNALERDGFLVRRQNTDDRRKTHLDLTESGAAKGAAIYENLHNIFETFFSKLGEEDARGFLELEKKVVNMCADGTIVIAPPEF